MTIMMISIYDINQLKKNCLQLAKKHNMVIVSSILERDEEHGEVLANTAGIQGDYQSALSKDSATVSYKCRFSHIYNWIVAKTEI